MSHHNQPLLDQTGTVQGVDANTSVIAIRPKWIQIEGIDPAETVVVRGRLGSTSAWVDIQEVLGSDTSKALIDLSSNVINEVCAVVLVPTAGTVIISAQR